MFLVGEHTWCVPHISKAKARERSKRTKVKLREKIPDIDRPKMESVEWKVVAISAAAELPNAPKPLQNTTTQCGKSRNWSFTLANIYVAIYCFIFTRLESDNLLNSQNTTMCLWLLSTSNKHIYLFATNLSFHSLFTDQRPVASHLAPWVRLVGPFSWRTLLCQFSAFPSSSASPFILSLIEMLLTRHCTK